MQCCEVRRRKRRGSPLSAHRTELRYARNVDWFKHSPNWPRDPQRAVAVVRELIDLKSRGLPICNTRGELETMIPYFLEPERSQLAVQLHSAHEGQSLCCAMTTLQLEPNGDVGTCFQDAARGQHQVNAYPADLEGPSAVVGGGLLSNEGAGLGARDSN